MTRHEQTANVHVVEEGYLLDTLGAPFNVVLSNGVDVSTDPTTGEQLVTVRDMVGLIGAVVRSRVCHTRKLNGAEIKFVRDALGVQAKVLAEYLDLSPEHLSRCENGSKAMSPANERLFRFVSYLATFLEKPAEIFVRPSEDQYEEIVDDLKSEDDDEFHDFVKAFFSMKIEPLHDVEGEPLVFEFVRKPRGNQPGRTPDDDKWTPDKVAA